MLLTGVLGKPDASIVTVVVDDRVVDESDVTVVVNDGVVDVRLQVVP